MNFDFKHHRKRLFFAGASVVCVGLGVFYGAAGSGRLSLFSKPSAEVTLTRFVPGTPVDYRILAGTDVLAQDRAIVGANGVLSLPVEDDVLTENSGEHILYELGVRPLSDAQGAEESAQMLNVLLDLDRYTGDVSVSASGLSEYAGVALDSGTQQETLHADWAGLLSAKIGGSGNDDQKRGGDDDVALKLAFQNVGVAGDIEELDPGEIQVFFSLFGDNNGSNLTKVQERWSWALIAMTEQLSAVMAMQTKIIGMFIDAHAQMKTQRKIQELMARAHKDYHPSDQMCRIGTFVRSVAHTETKSQIAKHFLNKMLIEEYTGVENTVAAGGIQVYENARIEDYVTDYCDTKDNNAGIESFCDPVTSGTPAAKMDRLNRDIDYTRTLTSKLTLDVDFSDTTVTSEEEDIIALAKHLYFPSAYAIPDQKDLEADHRKHFDSRSYAAKMGVAHNAFINIVGMKSRGPSGQPTAATASSPAPPAYGQVPPPTTRTAPNVLSDDAGWAYMKAMMREFGLADADIHTLLGDNPSYYAQMEVLTKKIYQSPDFYTNLYDKPANVERIGASLDAISLMHQRDRFESLLRREMLTAVLVEEELKSHAEEVDSGIYEAMQHSQVSD